MDPRLATELIELVDERVAQLERARPRTAYGVVSAVDTVNRKATVLVSGGASASGGFSYPPAMQPAVGDVVRVVIDPHGDRYVDASYGAAATVPTGTVVMYGGNASTPPTEAPPGWLLCRGAAVSRTTYAALFAVIGTMYGAGDGSTTFNLPNWSLRFPLGASANAELGDTGGALNHTHTGDAHTHPSAAHSHPLSDNGAAQVNMTTSGSNPILRIRRSAVAIASWVTSFNFNLSGTSAASVSEAVGVGLDGTTDSATPGSTGAATAGSTGTNNPPYQKINFIIKT